MPAYNQTLDLISKFWTKWQATPGLDIDAEIEATEGRRSRPSGTRAGNSTMAAPSVARPQDRASASPGSAWRRARWGYVFIAPWLIGFVLFTLPDGRHAASRSPTSTWPRTSRSGSSGWTTTPSSLGDQPMWESLGVTFKFAALALPVAVVLPFLVALMLHSRHLRGAGGFRVLFFLPYVVPFVAGVLIWGGMLNQDSGWINGVPRGDRDRAPAGWLEDPTWIYPGLVIMGIWGIGAGMIVYLADSRASRPTCTRRPRSTAPARSPRCATSRSR